LTELWTLWSEISSAEKLSALKLVADCVIRTFNNLPAGPTDCGARVARWHAKG